MKPVSPLFKPVAVLALLAAMAGCQTVNPSVDTLKQRSEIALGVPVSKVSNVRNDSTLTYFTATTAKGEYNCQMPSGGIVAVAGMGLYDPTPSCLKEGQALILQ
ncbi:hypothetical protein KSS94_13820 [Pseudomonas fakonensis]|uniref:Lipoprotein n=1 Tax=Pseudomonas fakonensis TaxID=2842355 RepID=A0ABX8MZ10_9PSED|nr:hypothetical protein [Pseudomonas fakonensis]QXH49045.1 hypothetical protein KSS94_13820 [Pseudomonas fakonensis]